MDFSELVRQRQSVREYSSRPVERDKLDLLREAVRLAPSASNSQPWTLIFVDDPGLRERVAKACYSRVLSFNSFALQAPVIAVLTQERPRVITQIGGRIKDKEYPLIDIGVAAAHFCLQAAELGLGTCMIGWFQEQKIKDLLHIPQATGVGLLITVGYSEAPLRDKVRKPPQSMSSFNTYPDPRRTAKAPAHGSADRTRSSGDPEVEERGGDGNDC
jgi:nitroreductase